MTIPIEETHTASKWESAYVCGNCGKVDFDVSVVCQKCGKRLESSESNAVRAWRPKWRTRLFAWLYGLGNPGILMEYRDNPQKQNPRGP